MKVFHFGFSKVKDFLPYSCRQVLLEQALLELTLLELTLLVQALLDKQ